MTSKLLVILLLASMSSMAICFVAQPKFHRRAREQSVALQAMQIWLDARSVSPADLKRVEEADAWLATNDVPSPFPSDASKPKFIIDENKKIMLRDHIVGTAVDIADAAGQDEALAAVGSVEWILAICEGDWRMIPAENLIAAAKSAGTKLAFSVERVEDVVGLSRALELGVDALCLAADADNDLWNAAIDARTERGASQPEKKIAEDKPNIVTGICWRLPTKGASTVLADRVCVDVVRTLKSTEGCWVGSSAKVMALVLSEAATSSFVPSRPFRVNAGPVHSYVLLGDGVTTKYLCELEAGEEVLVYDSSTGLSRPVAVGRLKIEVRPCVVVGLKSPSTQDKTSGDEVADAQIFLQQAETVRLGKENGADVRVTELDIKQVGSKNVGAESILLRITGSGTHVGKAYTGKVDER